MFPRSRGTLFTLAFLLALMAFGPGAGAGSKELPPLTVGKALELALKENPLIGAAQKRIEQEESRILQAASAKSPQLNMSLGYEETKNSPEYPVFDRLTGQSTRYYAMAGFRRTWRAALSMNLLVSSGGSVENSVEARRLAKQAAQAELERTRQSVENQTASACYNLQRASARVEVAREALDLAAEHLRQTKAFYENGIVAKNEVLRVEVAHSDAKLKLIQAENALDTAWSTLERVVGVSLEGRYRLPEPPEEPGGFLLPVDSVDTAMANRPELKALERSRQSALAMAEAAMGETRPKILLTGETYLVDDEFFPDPQDEWRVGISAVWTLHDGGKAKARAAEARASAEEFLFNLEDLRRSIVLEVKKAANDLEAARQRVNVARAQVASAEEDHRMALRRYAAQVGTNIDVLDARVALENARTQYVDAVHDALQARADLVFAMGLPLDEHVRQGVTTQ
ncbi:MAG: TolC family protein [Thermovirgaceae bacterium]